MDGASVLITGGTGSFGRRLAQTLLDRFDLKRLVVFSRDELKQSQMAQADFATGERGDLSASSSATSVIEIVCAVRWRASTRSSMPQH